MREQRWSEAPHRSIDDQGSTTVELVVLTPLVGLLLAGIVLVGRVQGARADVEGAARSAARDLSIARDPQAAAAGIEAGVAETLHVGSATCQSMTFTPTITGTSVSVTIACQIDLADVSVLPVPGSMTITASADEVVDVYRESNRS